MISRRRVVETYDPATEIRGSGFLLSPSIVLTARHCVPAPPGRAVAVRASDDSQFRHGATVRWVGAGDCDVALVELPEGERVSRSVAPPVWLGRPVAVMECQAVGFPWAQERPGQMRPRTAAEAPRMRLSPLTGLRAGTYDLDIESAEPETRAPGSSPWSGMSGAALFAEGSLIGVVTEDPRRFGPNRLRAVPVEMLLQDEEAAGILAPGIAGFGPVWPGHREVLVPPYEPLPVPSPVLLLQPRYASLPFHSVREEELDDLCAWCDDHPSVVAVGVVDGVGGTGKTRLAAELCTRLAGRDWVTGLLAEAASEDPLRDLAALGEPRVVAVDAAESRAEEILALARAVAARPQQAPFRLLLVARSAGAGIESAAWWRALQGSRNPLQAAFVSAQHRTLASLPTGTMGVDERRSVFRAARKRFAALLDLPMTTVEPDLGQPAYDTFLFLQIGALVALTSSGEVPTEEAAVLDGVLETERELIGARRRARTVSAIRRPARRPMRSSTSRWPWPHSR